MHCWGLGVTGQLGYGNLDTIGDDETPASAGIVDLGFAAVQIDAGEDHTCAISSEGAVRCWGLGLYGRLGYGNTATVGDDETPASLAADVDVGMTVTQLSAGRRHTCAASGTGAFRCWGNTEHGALGYGSFSNNIGDNESPASAGDIPLP